MEDTIIQSIYKKCISNIDHISIFIFFYILTLLYVCFGNHIFFIQFDERVYLSSINTWNQFDIATVYNISGENKTIFFLYIQKILGANIIYTRILNVLLIIGTMYLLYSLSGNKLAFLYPLIILFLNSMWLTVEIIEVFIMLLGFKYLKNHMGVAVGLACLFRPYAVIYSLFMDKRNMIYIIIIGLSACAILYMNDVLFIYAELMIGYGSNGIQNKLDTVDTYSLFLLIPLIIAGYKNWHYSKYAFAGMVGLSVQMFAHYFIVPYTFFYLAYLTKGIVQNAKRTT